MNQVALWLSAALLLPAAGVQAQTVPAAPDAADQHNAAVANAPDAQADSLPVTQPVRGDGRQGTVKTVRGAVALTRQKVRRAATEGGAVWRGDRIVTGADSRVTVMLRDGTAVIVGPNSQIELASYRFDPTTEDGNIALSLFKGSVRVVTGLITRSASESAPARVKVTTPTAVIGVRGTDVVIDTDS